MYQKRSFLAGFFKQFGRKYPQTKQLPWKPNKTSIINSTSLFLPLIDNPNGLSKLKFAVFEIIGEGGGGGELAQPPFVESVGTN